MSLYKYLNLTPSATMKDIDLSYKNLKKTQNTEKAFNILSDYNSRRQYDIITEDNELDDINNDINENNYYIFEDNTNDQKLSEDNLINESNIKSSLDNIFKLMVNINMRLDNIEKEIYKKKDNNVHYVERKKITTSYNKGKKTTNILTNINNNGKYVCKKKSISYDQDGNEIITYTTYKNPKKL